MDEKTAELRDIFIDTTGSDTVTENQEEARGSLTDDERRVRERVLELVATMRDRYEFATDLPDEALERVVRGFHEGQSDAELADALDVDENVVFAARMDLHLVRDSDRDAPFDLDRMRTLLAEEAPAEQRLAELDTDAATFRRYRRVVETETRAVRTNGRFRDEFAELLTDSDLSGRLAEDARRDGLKEATEDIETDVSF